MPVITAGSCRTVDWWKSSQSLPKTGRRHQVDKRSPRSRPKALSSPSRQEVVTQSTEGGCRHQVSKKGMSSPSRQEVVSQSTEGVGTPSQPRSGDTNSTQGAGTPSQPRSGDTKSTHGKRGGDTKSTHGVRGDTKSTHGKREGTPSQPTERERTPSHPTEEGRGHQVNPRKSRRAYQLIEEVD